MKEKKSKCKYCSCDLEAKTTRREFCSPKCKVYWHRGKKAPQKPLAPQEQRIPPKTEKSTSTQDLTANRPKTVDAADKKMILEMIAEVKARKRPSYISGDKFEALRKIEIESLEKQLL